MADSWSEVVILVQEGRGEADMDDWLERSVARDLPLSYVGYLRCVTWLVTWLVLAVVCFGGCWRLVTGGGRFIIHFF